MTYEENIFNPETHDDDQFEGQLRPIRFKDYIGQVKVVSNITIAIEAARRRNDPLDHVLLYGPPGLGKTTLAMVIASELGVNIKTASGPTIEKRGDLAAILTNLDSHDVLFIDEIHRLHPAIEEILYPAMEDFTLDLIIGEGPSARSVKIDLPHFTLIGATTRLGLLTAPLRARFGLIHKLDFYSEEELSTILRRSAKLLKIEANDDGIAEIAKRSRGTPRIANRLLKRVRDYVQVRSHGKIDSKGACEAFRLLEVDENGIDIITRSLMVTIIEKFNGGPVGIGTLAAATGEEKDTIEDIYEPFLIQKGFLERTPRGRIATKHAYDYFNKKLPPGAASFQKKLF